MIVKMKKIFMVVQDKDMFSTLESLCAVGVVHVEHHQRPSGKEISSLKDDVCCLERVVDTLSQQPSVVDQMDLMPMQHQGQYSSFGMIKKDVWEGKAEEILGLVGLIAQYEENLGKRQIQINQWEAWGNFDPEDIEMLEKKGFYIRFVEVPENKLDQCPEGVVLEKIFARDGIARCLAISREEVKLPFTGIPLLPISLEDLKNEQEHDAQRIVTAEEKIAEDVKYSESFKNILSAVKEDLMFHQVYEGRGSEVSLSYIKGFCPEDKTAELQTVAQKGQWGLLVEDPAENDNIPTMLKNPKWVNFIKPVFDFINIVPGYKEVDISMFFLIFFSIFVGMLIGDAGYGMLFLLLTGWTQATTGKKVADKTPFFLVYVLCGCIIGWGVLTGTFFGQQWLPSGTFQPVLPWLKNNENIQMFCFLLGAVHLSVAHVWRAIMKAPSIAFLSEVGWLALVWGMFFAAKMLILGAAMPGFAKLFFIVGPVLVVGFTSPNKNPLKAIGPGLGDLALNVINTFTDVVSYIRLFAVGLATVAVADATNAMAMDIGFGSPVSAIITLIILFIGHTINIILALMAILVHGLRLNVLEFSGHLNMEWAGFSYSPFRRIRKA